MGVFYKTYAGYMETDIKSIYLRINNEWKKVTAVKTNKFSPSWDYVFGNPNTNTPSGGTTLFNFEFEEDVRKTYAIYIVTIHEGKVYCGVNVDTMVNPTSYVYVFDFVNGTRTRKKITTVNNGSIRKIEFTSNNIFLYDLKNKYKCDLELNYSGEYSAHGLTNEQVEDYQRTATDSTGNTYSYAYETMGYVFKNGQKYINVAERSEFKQHTTTNNIDINRIVIDGNDMYLLYLCTFDNNYELLKLTGY